MEKMEFEVFQIQNLNINDLIIFWCVPSIFT